MDTTQGTLKKTAVRELRSALHATDPETRTAKYRRVADLLVDLREFYIDQHGTPDWRGKTFAYRDAVRAIYSEAGLDSDPNNTTKAAIRYHIGNVLRERLDSDTLESLNLAPSNPRDRQKVRHNAENTGPHQPENLISSIYFLAQRLNDVADEQTDQYTLARATDASAMLRNWLAHHGVAQANHPKVSKP